MIYVRSQAAGKLVLPNDPALPIATKPQPDPTGDRGANADGGATDVVVDKREDGRGRGKTKTGTETTIAIERPIEALPAPAEPTPDTLTIRYILRGGAPRHPGSISSASDLSDGLKPRMSLTLSNVTGTYGSSRVTVSGNYMVDSVEFGGGQIGEYQTATLRKVSQK